MKKRNKKIKILSLGFISFFLTSLFSSFSASCVSGLENQDTENTGEDKSPKIIVKTLSGIDNVASFLSSINSTNLRKGQFINKFFKKENITKDELREHLGLELPEYLHFLNNITIDVIKKPWDSRIYFFVKKDNSFRITSSKIIYYNLHKEHFQQMKTFLNSATTSLFTEANFLRKKYSGQEIITNFDLLYFLGIKNWEQAKDYFDKDVSLKIFKKHNESEVKYLLEIGEFKETCIVNFDHFLELKRIGESLVHDDKLSLNETEYSIHFFKKTNHWPQKYGFLFLKNKSLDDPISKLIRGNKETLVTYYSINRADDETSIIKHEIDNVVAEKLWNIPRQFKKDDVNAIQEKEHNFLCTNYFLSMYEFFFNAGLMDSEPFVCKKFSSQINREMEYKNISYKDIFKMEGDYSRWVIEENGDHTFVVPINDIAGKIFLTSAIPHYLADEEKVIFVANSGMISVINKDAFLPDNEYVIQNLLSPKQKEDFFIGKKKNYENFFRTSDEELDYSEVTFIPSSFTSFGLNKYFFFYIRTQKNSKNSLNYNLNLHNELWYVVLDQNFNVIKNEMINDNIYNYDKNFRHLKCSILDINNEKYVFLPIKNAKPIIYVLGPQDINRTIDLSTVLENTFNKLHKREMEEQAIDSPRKIVHIFKEEENILLFSNYLETCLINTNGEILRNPKHTSMSFMHKNRTFFPQKNMIDELNHTFIQDLENSNYLFIALSPMRVLKNTDESRIKRNYIANGYFFGFVNHLGEFT